MSEFERGSPSSPQRPGWPAARIAWVLLGMLALVAGGGGAYFSLRPGSGSQPAPVAPPGNAALFQLHASPRPVPDIAFEDGQGRNRALSEFRDRFVLVNLWATWCAPCREEMPALDRLQQKLGGPGFQVLALSVDSGGAAVVKRFYDEIGIRSLVIYVDPAMRAMGTLAVVGIPTTLLLDRQGREIGRRTGPARWDAPGAVRAITGYMGPGAKP